MKIIAIILISCFATLIHGVEQSAPPSPHTTFETQNEQIAHVGRNIDELQEQLHRQIERYNQLIAQQAEQSGGTAVIPAPEMIANGTPKVPQGTTMDMIKRIELLENEVATLKAAKPNLEGARTQAEAEATKKAAANAPLLKVDTPATAQYAQAQALMKNGELEKAKEAFLQIVENYPEDAYVPRAYLHLGEIHLHLKNFGEAEKAFTTALTGKLEETLMVDARLGLAQAEFELDKGEKCCNQLTIIQKEPLTDEQNKSFQQLMKRAKCSSLVKKAN